MDGRKLVGWNVRKLRVALGLSIEELAGQADAADAYVSKLERGQVNVSVDLLERLAKPLRCGLSDFFIEPKPGEQPPAPLKGGRRPRRQPTAEASQDHRDEQPNREMILALVRRARVTAKDLTKFIPLWDKASRGGGSAREILLRLRDMDLSPGVARMVDEHLEADAQRRKGAMAPSSKPQEQKPEHQRGRRHRRNPQGVTRSRSPH